MVETIVFMKALGLSTLFVALIGGVGYWIGVTIKKSCPDFKFWVKYKVLRMKYNEQDVAMLLDDIEAGVNEEELFKAIILSNKMSPKKAKELRYIFKELNKIQMKGGIKNE